MTSLESLPFHDHDFSIEKHCPYNQEEFLNVLNISYCSILLLLGVLHCLKGHVMLLFTFNLVPPYICHVSIVCDVLE